MLDKEVKFMSKRCPNCGHEIQDGDTFCIHCGYKLVQNQKNELTKNNDKSSSLKNKWQPKKSMKVLETSSENIHEEQTQEFWKKKSFWGLIVVIAIGVLIVRANTLPKGYSNPNDVMEYSLKRNVFLNDMQGLAQGSRNFDNAYGGYGIFDSDNDDDDHWQLLENKKTKRYVFKYSYDGDNIPSYVVLGQKYTNGTYQVIITPVKKGHIAGIFKDEVSQDYIDKHFPAEKYVGYSNDDLEDMGVDLDSHIHTSDHGKTEVYYDSSRNE